MAEHEDPTKASRPFDTDRNGIVISEGGTVYTLERLSDALKRNAKIYAEIVGYAVNSDASGFVLPNSERQTECMGLALKRAGLKASDINIVNTHATGTSSGDIQECKAVGAVFNDSPNSYINNTKSFIGHTMGAAGALELCGNIPSFTDGIVHPTINVDNLDEACALNNLVLNEPKEIGQVNYILNSSFGMVGINSTLIIAKY